jgi:hypothetical protein
MLNDFLHVLVGAFLVAIGILAAALADRIRGLRVSSRAAEAPQSRRPAAEPRSAEPLRVVTPADLVQEAPANAKRAGKPESQDRDKGRADAVISALVGAGYKKPIATEAVWSCGRAERETVEGWTTAALRRCARGAVS